MVTPTIEFNVAMAARYANWYDLLPQVEEAMREEDRIFEIRRNADWECDEGGWYSPCGISESDWEHEYGYPFPEDPEYAAWADAYYHYEKLDSES
jgi:hypothetical protein